jgi:hypothetical protein
MYAHEMHTYEMHAYEMYAREMHACEMHAHEMYAREMHACEMHADETHVYEMRAYEMHAYEMHACTRWTPMRYTCMRCTPGEIHPCEIHNLGFWEKFPIPHRSNTREPKSAPRSLLRSPTPCRFNHPHLTSRVSQGERLVARMHAHPRLMGPKIDSLLYAILGSLLRNRFIPRLWI